MGRTRACPSITGGRYRQVVSGPALGYDSNQAEEGGQPRGSMNTAEFLLKGLVVGFLVAAPVGPVAVMCIHRTIAHGRTAGYICGLGATCADTVFGAVAALGLGFIAGELMARQDWLRMGGGILLIGLGLRLALSRQLSRRAEAQEREEERGEQEGADDEASADQPSSRQGLDDHIGNFVSAFAVMITNPITLVSFAAVFAAVDVAEIHDKTIWALALVAGVFLGGALWWTTLITLTSLFRHRINERGILWVSRGAGVLILIFGILILFVPGLLPQRV
jgi:threonine/homoserine/homoserine lactone efflux protein